MDKHAFEMSPDATRLLYAIGEYTAGHATHWLKEFNVGVIVHVGVKSGVFTRYNLAPSLFTFRGVKMFAMISQEALIEIESFFHASLIERVLLSTEFYAPISAIRISSEGSRFLSDPSRVTSDDRAAVDGVIRCPSCGDLIDFAVSRKDAPSTDLVMNQVCNCKTGGAHRTMRFLGGLRRDQYTPIESFFSIGAVLYQGRAYFLGDGYA